MFLFVLERNLNPKAACLKRREEEKAEDNTPKLGGGHHLGHGPGPHMVQPPYHTMPPVCFTYTPFYSKKFSFIEFVYYPCLFLILVAGSPVNLAAQSTWAPVAHINKIELLFFYQAIPKAH